MVSISTLIGTIPKQDGITLKEKDEEFFKFDACFDGVKIPVVISKYLWTDDLFGKVQVLGYLDTSKNEDGTQSMHIYAHTISSVPIDEPESNVITLYARINKLGDSFPTKRGVDIRKIVATQTTHTGKTVVLHITARKSAARALGVYNKGDYLKACGHLCNNKGVYSISVDTIPNTNSEEEDANG